MATSHDAILFDMDGVIADTESSHVAAEIQTCQDYGFAIDPAEWGGFKGRTADDIFTHLIETYGDPTVHSSADLIEHKTDVFIASLEQKLQPIDGVMDFLDWSRGMYRRVGLVTSSNRRVQRFITTTLGIHDMFDAVVTGDDITEGKPSPQPYQLALGTLGIHGSQTVVIEDSRSGIESGLAAGCEVLAIATSHPIEELAEVSPTYISATYADARRQLTPFIITR